MNIHSATALALGHAVAVGLVGTALGLPIRRLLVSGPRAAWFVLLLPLLTPALLVGYAYSNSWLAGPLVRRPWLNEGLYVALLIVRFTPIVAGMLWLAPEPPMSSEARFLARQVWLRGGRGQGPMRNWALAFAVVFVLVFAEFDLADLMQIKTWAVWLMNAQAGGWALRDSLYFSILPLACQLAVLVAVVVWWWRSGAAEGQREQVKPLAPTARVAVWCYLVVAAGAGCVLPGAAVWHWAIGGFAALWRTTIAGDIATSLLYAVVAAGGAAGIAALLVRGRRVLATLVACLPGLAGSLLLGLVVLALFVKTIWYDTALPLLVALVLLLLPVAVLAAVLLAITVDRPAIFLARRLPRSGRQINWVMRDRGHFWAFALLVYLACFDLGATYLLRPSGHNFATVRMYDLMHYGRSAVLSATVMTTVLAIFAALGVARVAVAVMRGLRG